MCQCSYSTCEVDGNPASTETEHTGGELELTSLMDVEGGSVGERAKDGGGGGDK